jgi:hypothetical protein
VWFQVVGPIENVEIIARGGAIRELSRLRRLYGGKHWRKLKGVARVELADRWIARAELHWYEAHGIGRYEMKVKRLLE